MHHDLKPENVLVDALGTMKIADFGLSISGALGEERGGTLMYMPPEALRELRSEARFWLLLSMMLLLLWLLFFAKAKANGPEI